MKYILFVTCLFVMLNAQQNIDNTESNSQSDIYEELEKQNPQLDSNNQSGGLILLSTQDLKDSIDNYYLPQDNNQEKSLLDNVYGHIGFFGKTNMLGKNNDSYGVFSGSMGLTYDFLNSIYLNVGIYGIAPFMDYPSRNSDKYVTSKFVTNNAYIKYKAEGFYSISIGRYREDRDWLKHYVQGVGIDINYSAIKVWGNWVDEQAHVSREYLTDFDIYKKYYNRQWLIASGIGINIIGLEIAPYYYLMNDNFWAAGTKVGLDFDINKEWNTTTTMHYALLHAKTDINHKNYNNDIQGSSMQNGEESSILWIEEALSYQKDIHSVIFGAGYIKVWDAYFELANMGNISRFETDSYYGYNGIEPGEIYNGTNSGNTFNANTSTIYGFLGYKMDIFSTMLLGRYSKSNTTKQDLYSIGAKWKIVDGLYIGGVVAYMKENGTNMSFAKGYFEFAL